jgi:hypothetical protein
VIRAGKLRRKKGVVKRFFSAFKFNNLRGLFPKQLEPQKFAKNASVLSASASRETGAAGCGPSSDFWL